MKNKKELAREYVISNFSFAYYNDDINSLRLEESFVKGFEEALKTIKAIYEKDGLAAVEKYVKKELK